MYKEISATRETPAVVACDHQPEAREGQAGPCGVADWPVVPLKPGNAGGGKGPWFKASAGRGEGPGEWHEPTTSGKDPEAPGGATRQSEGVADAQLSVGESVMSCPKAGCGSSACPV